MKSLLHWRELYLVPTRHRRSPPTRNNSNGFDRNRRRIIIDHLSPRAHCLHQVITMREMQDDLWKNPNRRHYVRASIVQKICNSMNSYASTSTKAEFLYRLKKITSKSKQQQQQHSRSIIVSSKCTTNIWRNSWLESFLKRISGPPRCSEGADEWRYIGFIGLDCCNNSIISGSITAAIIVRCRTRKAAWSSSENRSNSTVCGRTDWHIGVFNDV